MKISFLYFLSAVCICICICGCDVLTPPHIEHQMRLKLGTVCEIQIVGREKEHMSEIIKEGFDRIDRYEELFSVYRETSEISMINRDASRRAVQISSETYDVLHVALEAAHMSGGLFDITVFPFMRLWGFVDKDLHIPTESEIAAVKKIVGCDQVMLSAVDDTYTVRFETDGVMIDLGGIAKGYICDRVSDFLRSMGYKNFLVNIGGNIYAAGHPPFTRAWQVGIRNPIEKDMIVRTLSLSNQAVSTSGDYERYFEHNGERYAHIIDPATGYPVKTQLVSATVISENAFYADIASTVSFLARDDKRLLYLEKLKTRRVFLLYLLSGELEEKEYTVA